MADQDERCGPARHSAGPRCGPWSPAGRWHRASGRPRAARLVDDRAGHAMRAEDRRPRRPGLRRALRRNGRPWPSGAPRHGGCARSHGAHRSGRRSAASARSTMSIARTTPAQKPRGWARTIFRSLGFLFTTSPSRYAELILILEQPRIPHATLMSSDAPESSASSERGKRHGGSSVTRAEPECCLIVEPIARRRYFSGNSSRRDANHDLRPILD